MITESNRPHIAVVGRRNAGKSLLVNLLLGQNVSKVSQYAGTTIDPVKTKYELLPYGPVVIVDTAGIDDEGELGRKRITETTKILSSSDFAIVVVDARYTLQNKELELLAYLDRLQINYIIVVNKIEFGVNPDLLDELKDLRITHFEVSCKEKAGIEELKRSIIKLLPEINEPPLISDIVSQGDFIMMIIHNDINVPRGKLLLSQVQLIRESLDKNSVILLCREKEFESVFNNLKSYPDLVIIDNESIKQIGTHIPDKVKFTTFSILMARYKANLSAYIKGLIRIENLKNYDKILIAEACLHHSQDDDLGRVKIPRWLQAHTKTELQFDFIQGAEYPENLSDYKLIIHCGGCILTRRSMQTRINEAKFLDIPIVNFGVVLSYMNGAIPRAFQPFPDVVSEWDKTRSK